MKDKIKTAFATLKKIGRVSGVECVVGLAFLTIAIMLIGQVIAALATYGVACMAAWFAWLHFGEHERAAKHGAEVEPFASVTVAAKPKRRTTAKPKKNTKPKPRKK